MKYKNIYSAIHNFGDSYISFINYTEDGYVIDDLLEIHRKGIDIELNWLARDFQPIELATKGILKSIRDWSNHLKDHLASENVEIKRLSSLYFIWPAKERKFMVATDDRGKEYKIYIREIK